LAKFQSPRSIAQPKIIGPEQNVNSICNSSLYTPLYFTMIWDIDLIFGLWMYNHKLQINFEIHSGWMIFGQLTAVGLWNLAKYLVNLDMIRNLQHLHMNKKSYTYKTLPFNSHWMFFWEWWQLNIWPKLKVQGLSPLYFTMIWDIDLIFGLWMYNHKLQINFEIHSKVQGP
jgi:hypothetical protein